MCTERSAGAAQHGQGRGAAPSRRGSARGAGGGGSTAPLAWLHPAEGAHPLSGGLWPQPREDPKDPPAKCREEAAPERPEIPGASSWASAAQKMWLLLCRAGLSSRVHRGKDLTQDHTPHPLPLTPTQTHPILQHFPTNHCNIRRAPDSIRNCQPNCLVVQGNTSRFFFPASEPYLFI